MVVQELMKAHGQHSNLKNLLREIIGGNKAKGKRERGNFNDFQKPGRVISNEQCLRLLPSGSALHRQVVNYSLIPTAWWYIFILFEKRHLSVVERILINPHYYFLPSIGCCLGLC